MKRYIISVLLLCSSFLMQNSLYATKIYSQQESLQILEENEKRVKQNFLKSPDLNHYDPDKSIRLKLFMFYNIGFFSLSEEIAAPTLEEVSDKYDYQFKRFLKFNGDSGDGNYDLNDIRIQNLYVLYGYYAIDRTFHKMLVDTVTNARKDTLLVSLDKLTPWIANLRPDRRFLNLNNLFTRIQFQIKCKPFKNDELTETYIKEFLEILRQKYLAHAMAFLSDPNLKYDEFTNFEIQHRPSDICRLTISPDLRIYEGGLLPQIWRVYENFLQDADSMEKLKDLRASLFIRSYDFYEFSQPMQMGTSDSNNGVVKMTQEVAVSFFMKWMNHTQKDLYPISAIDCLYCACLAANLNDNIQVKHIQKFEIDFPIALTAIENQDEVLELMLNFIKTNISNVHRKYKILGSNNIIGSINAFQARMARKLEEEKLKAQKANKARADGMFKDRLKVDLQKVKAELKVFLERHEPLKFDSQFAIFAGLEHAENSDGLMGVIGDIYGTYFNQKWHSGIARTIKDLELIDAKIKGDAQVTINDLKALDQKAKEMNGFYKEADSFFEKESKLLKKRKKDEVKALKKELRAKQKAEERAKRASTQLASSPDPSPYPSAFPSVHADLEEKRLSRAEIAEKHLRQIQKDEEKRNSKSLRQSLKGLLHIGQADEQTDKRDSKRFSRSSKRPSEIATTQEPLDLSQYGAIDRQSLKSDIKDLWEGRKQLANANDQKAFVEILDGLNLATGLDEIGQSFSHGDNFEQLNSGKIKGFNYKKKDTVYSIRLRGNHAYRICFTWDGTNKKVCNVQFGDYH